MLIAWSGGCDSTLLLWLALQNFDDVKALTIRSHQWCDKGQAKARERINSASSSLSERFILVRHTFHIHHTNEI